MMFFVWSIKVQVTERDLELVRCINRFGFLTVEQVARFWGGVDFSTAAARVRKLVDEGLLERASLQHFEVRPLVVTRVGRELAGETLPAIKGIRASTFQHDSMLFDLAVSLETRFSSRFETEREYRWRRPDRAAENFHVPDGILRRDNVKIGVELELTQKAPRRLADIIASHAGNLELDEVWYVVTTEAMRAYVRRIAGDSQHIKIVKWTHSPTASVREEDGQ
ncbi:hypothetical protein [Devosia sp.]|uniref:hypothetical protein n=1 Tax=Devosia sp. TaxID=1871048 RepID=UPI002FC73550